MRRLGVPHINLNRKPCFGFILKRSTCSIRRITATVHTDIHPVRRRKAGYSRHHWRLCASPNSRTLLRLPVVRFLDLGLLICDSVCMKTQVIVADPDIMGGTPVFRGTRVPVQTLIDYLEAGDSIADFLKGFPTVTHKQVVAVLEQMKEQILVPAHA